MTPTWYQRGVLGLAGVTASGIGLAITFIPLAFYASYGIALEAEPNLLSELRAPGANLAALGLIMLGGALRPQWFSIARLVAITVFFAFAFGRVVGWVMDGPPGTGIQLALGVELGVGSLVLLVAGRSGARQRKPMAV